jgi:RNA polymerase sigma-70 factor (sigma-E family)
VTRVLGAALYETHRQSVTGKVAEITQSCARPREDESSRPRDFEEFFEAERPRLFRVLLLVTGEVHEAEDLLQEAFFKVWERWDRVGGMDNPVGYLHRTALNGFRSRYRRTLSAARKRLAMVPDAPDPLAAVEARDAALRALGALTRRQRAAVVLTELLDYSVEEAASFLSISPGTVRVLISQARAALVRRRDLEGD